VRAIDAAVWGYRATGSGGGGKVEQLSEPTNIVPFPLSGQNALARDSDTRLAEDCRYDFSESELAILCRWFSAMKYAFPGTEGVMIVSHPERYSAVGLYNRSGGAPNCLVAKHDTREGLRFFWSTEFDPPRQIGNLSEIINAHIRAIRPPRDEKGWLDPAGWTGVYTSRLIATRLQVV
jgi:hypothetical protein